MKVEQKFKVISLKKENKIIRRHLLDMGLTRGTEIEIKKIAPLGDPIDILLRDYELCISKKDLDNIELERNDIKNENCISRESK